MATGTNSSSASSSTGLSTVKLNIPPSLVFLASNIHSFVTIKLDSHNYVLWRTQIEHALKANSLFGYVDGSISCPSATAVRTAEVTLSEPDLALWTIVDSQLVSCLIATLSVTTLPLVLGLDHACQIWEILEHRFNSVSKTHVHDLKRKLYSVTKTSTLDAYFDTIKQLSYKLAAAGAPVSDEDLVFYTLHGLPSEFDPLQTALSTRVGDISFEELITILNGEEMRKNRSSTDISASVFVASPRPPISGSSSGPFSSHQGLSSGHVSQQQSGFESLQNVSQMGNISASNAPQMSQGSMFAAPFPQQYNNFRPNNRSKGFRYQRNGNRPACQICDKTNHTAKNCHHRLNLQYQPTYYNTSNSPQSYPQAHLLQYPQYQILQGQNSPLPSSPGPSYQVPYQVPPPNFSAGILPSPPQAYFSPGLPPPYTHSLPSNFTPNYSQFQPSGSVSSSTSSSSSTTSVSPGNWYLDSGATSHVTNELNNLSLQQPYTGNTGVLVGNGQNHQPDSTSGPFISGSVSNSGLY